MVRENAENFSFIFDENLTQNLSKMRTVFWTENAGKKSALCEPKI